MEERTGEGTPGVPSGRTVIASQAVGVVRRYPSCTIMKLLIGDRGGIGGQAVDLVRLPLVDVAPAQVLEDGGAVAVLWVAVSPPPAVSTTSRSPRSSAKFALDGMAIASPLRSTVNRASAPGLPPKAPHGGS